MGRLPGLGFVVACRRPSIFSKEMSAPSSDEPCVQVCPNCAALVDVSDQEPLAKFHCPTCGTAMRASRQYNHFSVVETLGQGGMGTVYKALDRNLNRLVALKLLRRELSDEEDYIAKLEDEARITASINHPYVVKVFSFGSDQGQYYIAMELVDKGSLDDLMQLQGRVSELQVLQVGLQVAGGLQAAHEAGLIHRDVKPGNILFADAHTAKITDFGLALLAEQEAEARGEIWGTPYYIAPEKLNRQPEDFRSDIYSLGGTLFHAVAGRPPFEAESASLVALKHLKSKAVSLQAFAPDVSGETAYVINRMLHKDPGERYASYGELLDHFKYAIDTLTANAARPRAAKQRVVVGEGEQQSNVAGLLTLVLLALMLAGGVLAFVFRDHFFGKPETTVAAVSPKALAGGDRAEAQAAYEDARHDIVTGRYADADSSLDALLQRTDLVPPLPSWARLHKGLTALLENETTESRAVFATLHQSAAALEKDPIQAKLGNFFLEMSRVLSDSKPVPAGAIKHWDKNTFERMALLLFGLKDWTLGDFEDADTILGAYLEGKPPAPYEWTSDYEPIARRCVHDYALYAPLRDRAKDPGADRAALRAEFAKARNGLQTTGKLVETFFAAEAALDKPEPTPTPAATPVPSPSESTRLTTVPSPSPTPTPVTPTPTPSPSVANAERLRWQTVRDSYRQQVALYHFDEAQAVLRQASITEPDFAAARNLTLGRAKAMVAFKAMLVADINSHHGYPKPVTSRRGITYPRGIQTAAGDNVEAGTPYGTVEVPWTDFSPPTLLAIAAYYTDATNQPAIAAERRWWAANFALETGLLPDARALAARAAKDQPAYAKDLAQFNGTIGTAAPLPPAQAAP